jgi:hypothetical protein
MLPPVVPSFTSMFSARTSGPKVFSSTWFWLLVSGTEFTQAYRSVPR